MEQNEAEMRNGDILVVARCMVLGASLPCLFDLVSKLVSILPNSLQSKFLTSIGVVCFSDAQDTALPPLRHSGLEGH